MSMANIDTLVSEMRMSAEEAQAAGDRLVAEGEGLRESLKRADTLAAFIVERALSTKEGDNIAIGFDSMDAATIANMALAYQQARAERTQPQGCVYCGTYPRHAPDCRVLRGGDA